MNATVAIAISLPVLYFFDFEIEWKLSAIIIFYLIQVADTHEHIDFRCLGMRIFGTVWAEKYSRFQRNVYSILYTLSFSTLFFYVIFPLDIFLFNIFVLQLPTILISGTTLHGLLAGGLRSKKRA